ncbi:hypothetical protein B9Z19DRAFT_1103236 [Tuber borchii]|uniref:C2H2-type domain-containing protein n=1 Tax=Tuber borchii TaxID=42251 RepID=A0A2T6ZHB3_TUBBO|nr:hypothetical protein B9Z19DRAFT_1103236 [Tuber borchii]
MAASSSQAPTSASIPTKDTTGMADFVLFDDDPLYQEYRPRYDNGGFPPSDVGSYVAMLEQPGEDQQSKFYMAELQPGTTSFETYPPYAYDDVQLPMGYEPGPAPGVLIHPPTLPYSPHGNVPGSLEYRTPISPATSAGGLEGSSAGSEAGSTGSPYPPQIDDPFNPVYAGTDIDPSLIMPSPTQQFEDPCSAASSRGSPSWHSAHSPPPTSNPSSPELGKRNGGRLSPLRQYRTAPYPSRRLSVTSQSSSRSHGSPSGLALELEDIYAAVPGDIPRRAPSSSGSGAGKDTLCPECKKSFRDLKAHQLTHQLERPVKCPIATCEYSKKGFARKYDCQRHTLTHYKGTMVCGFCPGSGSAAEKSFNRADVFKRHLMSVHNVEQTPPNSRKRPPTKASPAEDRYAGAYVTGKCSTCSITFATAQQFYEHLDECVLSKVVQEEPAAAFNEMNLDSVKLSDMEPSSSNPADPTSSDSEDEDEKDTTFSPATNKSVTKIRTKKGPIKRSGSGAGSTQSGKTKTIRRKRNNFPAGWGCQPEQMVTKRRCLMVFDGPKLLCRDEMMMSNEWEVRAQLGGSGGSDAYVSDLDFWTLRRAEAFLDVAPSRNPQGAAVGEVR